MATPRNPREKSNDSSATLTEPPNVDISPAPVPDVPEGTKIPKKRAEDLLQDQAIRLPLHRLLLMYLGIGLALFLSFLDQTSVSTAAPVIGTDIGGSESISWLGTAFLVANCAMHLVYGRLSDIFGRKRMLHVALLFLGFGNLLCGFAKTPLQLYVFRAISGLGGGGVNGIAMTVVSDAVSLKDRGKYQGFISAACSLGSAVGPFVGGGLATAGQWRWLFWLTCPLSVLIVIGTHFILPLKPVTGSAKYVLNEDSAHHSIVIDALSRQKLRQIDYLGIILSSGATVILLVPISGGGSTFEWNSAVVISLLIIGSVMTVAFVLCEWKLARLPILPLRLFKTSTVSILLVQSFLIGVIYYGNIFYVPMYLQYVKGYSALKSGALVLAYTFPQALHGIISGQIVSHTGKYKLVIISGTAFWALGAGLQLLWRTHSSIGVIIGILEVNSIGVGFCLQTTLVAMMAVAPDKDRAVITSARNFARTMGGAFGLAVANAVFNNVVSSSLSTDLSADERHSILHSSISYVNSLPSASKIAVVAVYAKGLNMCYVVFTAGSVVCFVLSFFIKEVPFRKDPPELQKEKKVTGPQSGVEPASNRTEEAG